MNYRSKIFLLSGIYALLAIFLTKRLFYNYYHGEEGINLLPLNLFEILIYVVALLTFVITAVTIAVLVKRNTHPLSFKKRFHFLIPSFMGWIILYLLLKEDMSQLIVPSSIVIYGLILINLNRFVGSKLVFFGISLILLGIISYFLPSFHWIFLVIGFGVFPMVFGILLLRKSPETTNDG